MTSMGTRSIWVAASVGLLAACGGGGADPGSGTGTGSGSAVAGGASANPAAVTRFTDLAVPAGFAWDTVQAAQSVGVTLTSVSRPVLGGGRVVISNFIDQDPTGSGAPMAPMSTDVIATALASNSAGPSAAASFGALRLPAGTTHVLVEVFDLANGARLASVKASVASLLASGLRIDV